MTNEKEKSSLAKESKEDKEEKQEQPSCCSAKPKKESKNIWQGIIYGIIPHVGCIAFIIGSVLGVTLLTSLFKPLLMNKNFFYILILLSLLLATISAVLYLRKNGFLSGEGVRKKWKYLATMYGTTIGVNLLLFLIIFPLLANVSAASSLPTASSSPGGAAGSASANIANANFAELNLKVDIPCSGHAPLISGELKKINGVQSVKFSLPNNFDVVYDPALTSKQAILSADIFKDFKATVVSEQLAVQQNTLGNVNANTAQNTNPSASTPSTGGCGCGGGGGAKGTCGVAV